MKEGSFSLPTRGLFFLLIALLVVDIGLHLAPASPAQAANPAPPGPAMNYPPFQVQEGRTRLFHVALVVEDLDRSIAFYTEELGFKLIRTQRSDLWKLALLTTGAGEPILEVEEYIGPNKENPPTGFSHIGMFVDDLDEYYNKSHAKGIPWSAAPVNYGGAVPKLGFMTDPDGYRVEMMANPKGACVSCHRGPHLP